MAPLYSFRQGLSAALKLHPKSIFEWGPGHSTLQMLACPSVERIISVEHNYQWYMRYLQEFKDDVHRLRLRHIADLQEYVEYPRGGFDLIYVDGMRRNQCLKRAQQIIRPDGIVLLHDAERASYRRAIVMFPFHSFAPGGHIAAMATQSSVIYRWEENL